VCDSARRTAINHEAGEYATIQTAAHELGHKSVSAPLSTVLRTIVIFYRATLCIAQSVLSTDILSVRPSVTLQYGVKR